MSDYPEYLDNVIATLPQRCGVYFFHGDRDTPVLYIGKSVNIRRRVRSHLSHPHEKRFVAKIRRISFIETIGEIGALLLESLLVKQKKPLYNKQLRKVKRLCAVKIEETHSRIVFSDETDFAKTPELYGLFSCRAKAISRLRDIADKERLCLTRLDIEKNRADRPCFRYQLGKCAGACCGKETPHQHQARLRDALLKDNVRHWPYPGRIALEERQDHRRVFHVISHWFYLGSVASLCEAQTLFLPIYGFDRDCYRILCRHLFQEDATKIYLIDSDKKENSDVCSD